MFEFLKIFKSRTVRIIAAVLLLLVILGAVFGYLTYSVRREKQARSDEHQERVDEAKEEVKQASENVNAVRNANYSNLNNDELRQRIINAARRQK